MINKIKIIIVDDSAIIRNVLSELIQEENDIEVIGTASDPYAAVKIIQKKMPDVIILDVQMPKMDGLTFLKKIMSQHPIPVIICSNCTVKGSDELYKAIEYGAIEVILKPKISTKEFLSESKIRICDAIRSAKKANLSRLNIKKKVAPKLTADVVIPNAEIVNNAKTERVITIGSSTGGTQALSYLFQNLQPNLPGIVVVQHMPENFTFSFAKRLNEISQLTIKEAEHGDVVTPGCAYIAPGNIHTILKYKGGKYSIELKKGPLVSRHRPSVDVLFRSTAKYANKNAIGIMLTGMGDDGARGMKEMKDVGSFNIAQSEDSCVVFGMPQEAIKVNAIDKILDLTDIPKYLARFGSKPTRKR